MNHLMPLAPMGVVALTSLILMLAIALKRSHFLSAMISIIGLNIALIGTVFMLVNDIKGKVDALFLVDNFALINMTVILMGSLACMTLAYRYFESFKDNKEELYLLMLISTLGAMLMVSSSHLASFFVSLELLSVPMYGMISYAFIKSKSLEAGLKYLILSAAASATLLMGMAMIYVASGELGFERLGLGLMSGKHNMMLVIVGVVMMVGAMAFKLSLAPFHAWAGDVYEGAPAPITNFLASVGKVAVMALAVRFFISTYTPALTSIDAVLVLLIALSIIAGNLLALQQTNLKRMLAYSSVAHMGYVLIALVSVGKGSSGIITMYMAIYALTSIGAFGVIVLMTGNYSEHDRNRLTQKVEDEADSLAVYQGLFWRRPVLTSVMTLMLLSMAGLPLTAGFITKLQILFAAVEGGRFWLAGLLIVGSAIGLFYYLKVLLVMFKRPVVIIPFDVTNDWRVKAGGLMVLLITAIIIAFGVLPNGLLNLANIAFISQ